MKEVKFSAIIIIYDTPLKPLIASKPALTSIALSCSLAFLSGCRVSCAATILAKGLPFLNEVALNLLKFRDPQRECLIMFIIKVDFVKSNSENKLENTIFQLIIAFYASVIEIIQFMCCPL